MRFDTLIRHGQLVDGSDGGGKTFSGGVGCFEPDITPQPDLSRR